MELRRLGRSGIKVSSMGLGTARLAGLGWHDELAPQDPILAKRDGVQQIQEAVDLGVTFFDTADTYGQGFCESVLGEALRGHREGIVVATKFGENPLPDQEDPWDLGAGIVERACEASLKRLRTECIDLYLLHRRDYPLDRAQILLEVLEGLVKAGKIRFYGWSTDDIERARLFAGGEHCTAIEHRLNVFNDNAGMLDLCREQDLASLNRGPLLMGVLTGRWSEETKLENDDPREQWFRHEEFLKVLACAQQVEPYLTFDGRSVVQGALGWIWGRSPLAIPLPGFRNMEQMKELVQAQQFGPLPTEIMKAIEDLVDRAGFRK